MECATFAVEGVRRTARTVAAVAAAAVVAGVGKRLLDGGTDAAADSHHEVLRTDMTLIHFDRSDLREEKM